MPLIAVAPFTVGIVLIVLAAALDSLDPIHRP